MKIQIITECEIEDQDYWQWADATLQGINAANEDDLGYTKAKTTYRIIK